MDRQTLRDWVCRYNAEGVEGLGNRRRDRVKLRLISDQVAQLATWVEDGPGPERDGVVRWQRVDLARRIEVDFGIKLHEHTVGTYLARLLAFGGCRCALDTPRPTGRLRLLLKKTLPLWLRRSCQTGEGKAFGDMVPGPGKGWSTRDADPHPGKARDTPVHPSRYALQMELYRLAFFAPKSRSKSIPNVGRREINRYKWELYI